MRIAVTLILLLNLLVESFAQTDSIKFYNSIGEEVHYLYYGCENILYLNRDITDLKFYTNKENSKNDVVKTDSINRTITIIGKFTSWLPGKKLQYGYSANRIIIYVDSLGSEIGQYEFFINTMRFPRIYLVRETKDTLKRLEKNYISRDTKKITLSIEPDRWMRYVSPNDTRYQPNEKVIIYQANGSESIRTDTITPVKNSNETWDLIFPEINIISNRIILDMYGVIRTNYLDSQNRIGENITYVLYLSDD